MRTAKPKTRKIKKGAKKKVKKRAKKTAKKARPQVAFRERGPSEARSELFLDVEPTGPGEGPEPTTPTEGPKTEQDVS